MLIATPAELASLFSEHVATSLVIPGHAMSIVSSEELFIAANYPSKRQREFLSGRMAAREALARLGACQTPILVNKDRSPCWPEDLVGSITHCEGPCGAAVAWKREISGVGFDIEVISPFSSAVEDLVCSKNEKIEFADLPPLKGGDWANVAFSAKEAFYKCFYPIHRRFLEFHDVSTSISIDGATSGSFRVEFTAADYSKTLENYKGRWLLSGGFVYAGCTCVQVAN